MEDAGQRADTTEPKPAQSRLRFYTAVVAVLLLITLCAVFFYLRALNQPPQNFPVDELLTIEEGMSAQGIAAYLETQHAIHSPRLFTLIYAWEFEGTYIQAGTYIFNEPLSTKEMVEALATGTYANPTYTLTFYEGVRGKHIVEILAHVLPGARERFASEDFDAHIGYLFPDTYFVEGNITSEELVARMRETYQEKTAHLSEAIQMSDLDEDEIITLASIVEREGNTEESMRIIAGILLERLRISMPLQVDATFEYVLGKASHELTEEDLALDSPYNTYTNRGLPPTPIANPGLTAIEAVLDPIMTDYLYYITGDDGEFYYAETFEEHKRNKELYL